MSAPTQYTHVDFGQWIIDERLSQEPTSSVRVGGHDALIGFDIAPSKRRTGPKRNAARRAAAMARIARRKAKRRSAR